MWIRHDDAGQRYWSPVPHPRIAAAVYVQATEFIGTRASSITQSLVLERLGVGAKGTNHYWESLRC